MAYKKLNRFLENTIYIGSGSLLGNGIYNGDWIDIIWGFSIAAASLIMIFTKE